MEKNNSQFISFKGDQNKKNILFLRFSKDIEIDEQRFP